jgi:CheY-like chemotaxis protein
MISVLIADDQDLIRKGLRMLLEAEPDLRVVGEAGDGGQALAQARRLDPDVILMDVRMPGLDGIQATAQLAEGGSRAKILMLTTFNLDEYVYHAMKGRSQRFPAQGRHPRAADRRHPHGLRRRDAARPGHHPPPDRGLLPRPGPRRRHGRQRCRPPDRAGTRGGAACRGGAVERRDRGQSLPQRGCRLNPLRSAWLADPIGQARLSEVGGVQACSGVSTGSSPYRSRQRPRKNASGLPSSYSTCFDSSSAGT